MLRVLRSGSKRVKTLWWAIAVVTIATFIGGFIFLFGAGFNSSARAHATGAIGTVNGSSITRADWQTALAEQRDAFKRNYGTEPAERDMKMIEVQTWRTLVTQHLLADQAKNAGLQAHDEEIKLTIKTSPPQAIATLAAFQTDGKFDPAKYRAALADPNQNWAPVEEMVRVQLPVRKLQERLLSSIKLAEPELRDAYRDRYEKLDATVIQLVPDLTTKLPTATDEELKKAYDQYKGRFSTAPRSQLELLIQPKKFGEEEVRAARELAVSLVGRARKGEDFAALARDYSDGPASDKGGEIARPLSPSDFGPELAPQIAAMKPGQINDPFQDNGRFVIIKYIDHAAPTAQAPAGGMRVAQIVVRVRPNENSLRDQYQALQKLREKAGSGGLGKAAAEAGLATSKTPYYDLASMPQQLYTVPEVADWGINAKVGVISPVFEGLDEFVIAQVAGKHAAGPPPREDLTDQLRQLADMEKRVAADKPRADAIAAELAQGKTLEQAAKDKGVVPIVIKGMTRANPEPRMFAVPELVGATFAAPPGKVLGPLRAVNGWYFIRADHRIAANPAMYDSLKGSLTSEILTRRQQNFFGGYLSELRDKAKVQDLRSVDVSGN